MTRAELLARISSHELSMWWSLYLVEAEEQAADEAEAAAMK